MITYIKILISRVIWRYKKANNMNEITKKLQKLAEQRKRSKVVTEQGFVNKKYSRSYGSSTSASDYYISSLEDN